jgi:RNA polymerase sigma-70 factor, ECF subfamily
MLAIRTAESTPQRHASARMNQSFERLAEQHRREIKLHCYRMMGSLHEADDIVQETYFRAWRSFDSFDGRGSFRAWLYKIATNACLSALESRKNVRRLMPDQLGAALEGSITGMPGSPATDVAWLEPYPDDDFHGVADEAPTPEARYASREAAQLAFVATIQQLPPRQRAALLLCDVLGWAAAEAAALLGGSTASINSVMQRARETLNKRFPDGRPQVLDRPDPAHRELLGRYLKAWESHDVDGFVALLREDAEVTMPPWLQWFIGREPVRSFFSMVWKTCAGLRLVPTAANGQPAFAVYELSATTGTWDAHSIHVLTLKHDAISALTLFVEPRLFPAFGLPPVLTDAGSNHEAD